MIFTYTASLEVSNTQLYFAWQGQLNRSAICILFFYFQCIPNHIWMDLGTCCRGIWVKMANMIVIAGSNSKRNAIRRTTHVLAACFSLFEAVVSTFLSGHLTQVGVNVFKECINTTAMQNTS